MRFLPQHHYIVFLMDFQEMSSASFKDEDKFVAAFIRCFLNGIKNGQDGELNKELKEKLAALMNRTLSMDEMFMCFSQMCGMSMKPIVLMIDEVDSAANNQVFMDFLGMFRSYYLNRKNRPTFHSVILAGVYDIKNLKMKIRFEKEHQYNSPWNIAADFDLDMSFTVGQIAAMLEEYEAENQTGMDVQCVSRCVYEYTSGYPYLVSAVCKILDEEIFGAKGFENRKDVWTKAGIMEAVKIILDKQFSLFQSMMHQLNDYPDLKRMLNVLLFQGKQVTFNPDNPVINLAFMFGYIINRDRSVQVANRIFEMRLYNYFLSEEELTSAMYHEAQGNKGYFFQRGRLDMKRVLEKFIVHFTDIYGENDEKFIEEYGRKFFLLYLKPIINGTGNYYIEAQTRDARRTDVIVDYLGEQFIIELKIWHGSEYNERGEKQLTDYLDYFHQEKGYMLSFNFNKKKERGIKELRIGSKTIVEAVV